ncbi:MAG: Rrf2 family transcriptional regulator [Thermogutta sp.]|uniref:RrF2 family transcriptional regulator n=1 Tax=Thermogutta sp. TaxID=1962930 RepID=UPI00198E93ED|nr:Rrf2 family transcriptional regulator [Thermogutta sp.]MBC7353540.1 Rrf2 family transcriptional regulator [Thermogutta sp.]GIX01365.1 MAG: Rrf2 family transcriptional regulator [Thermogutta sp.]
MKISAKTEYACVAMLELASRYESGGPVQVRKIAERHAVPSRFLVQIMLQLKAAGLVASTRGAAGGYRLAVPPKEITLGQVMDIVEGNKQPDVNFAVSSSPDSPAVKALVQAWQDIQRKERDMLYSITFADLLERARQYDTQMYYI